MRRSLENVRATNLEALIAEAGTAAMLARRAGTSPSYLSQVRNALPTGRGTPRRVSDGLATRLERAMDKPSGWMDDDHGHSAPSPRHQGGAGPRDWPRRHPVRSWRLPVGEGGGRGGAGEGDQHLACPVPCSEDTFVLQVKGASMEPLFAAGDFIFVDPHVPVTSGQYIVVGFADRDEAMLKQLFDEDGLRVLRAVHPKWPQALTRMDDDASVLGVVVFKGRRA